jgi:hypothetical protein
MRSVRFQSGRELTIDADELLYLDRGEALALVGPRPVEVVRGPRALDVGGSYLGNRRFRFEAVTDCEARIFARSEVEAGTWSEWLALECAAHAERLDHDLRREDDMFLDGAVPVPGPWRFERSDAFLLLIRADAGDLRALLPKGLVLIPGAPPTVAVVIAKFSDVGSTDPRDPGRFQYHEVTPFVPALSLTQGPVAYVPELFPDAYMAIVLGREIHGFPKRLARVHIQDNGADMILGRTLALRFRFDARRPVARSEMMAAAFRHGTGAPVPSALVARGFDAVEGRLPLRLPVVVRKRIGDPATSGRTASEDVLVRVPVTFDLPRDTAQLEGCELALAGRFPVRGRLLYACALTSGLTFGAGTVIRSMR